MAAITPKDRIDRLQALQAVIVSRETGQFDDAFQSLFPCDQDALRRSMSASPSYLTRDAQGKAKKSVDKLISSLQLFRPIAQRSTTPTMLRNTPSPSLVKRNRITPTPSPSPSPSPLFLLPPTPYFKGPSKVFLPALVHYLFHYLKPRDMAAFSSVDRSRANQYRSIGSPTSTLSLELRLENAIHRDDTGTLTTLLGQIPSENLIPFLNIPDSRGKILLFTAIREASLECLQLLFKLGARADLYEPYSRQNILHCAVANRDAFILKHLLDNLPRNTPEAIVNFNNLLGGRTPEGNTPLLSAVIAEDLECFKLLLDNGANLYDMNYEKHNILFFCAHHDAFLKEILKIHENLPEALPPLVNHCDTQGNNVLMAKAEVLTIESLNALFPLVNIFSRNDEGENFLFAAIDAKRADLLQAFLALVPDHLRKDLMNSPNVKRQLPITVAIDLNHDPCIECLIENGCDLFARNEVQDDLYSLTLIRGNSKKIQDLLLAKKPELEGFYALSLFVHVLAREKIIIIKSEHGREKIDYSGSSSELMRDAFLKFLKSYQARKTIKDNRLKSKFKPLIEALQTPMTPSRVKDLTKKIKKEKLVWIRTGWAEHAICLVFFKSYMVICNRGEGCDYLGKGRQTFLARKIDLTQLDDKLVDDMIDARDEEFKKVGSFFYVKLLRTLRAKEDETCREVMSISPKISKGGFCTYACLKAALRASLVLQTEDPARAKRVSKILATQHRQLVLDFFIKTPSALTPGVKKSIIAMGNQAMGERLEKMEKLSSEESDTDEESDTE